MDLEPIDPETALELYLAAKESEHAQHDSRSRAIQILHEVTVVEETENWEMLSPGWVDVDVTHADDWLRERSVASIRKPQWAVPNDIELLTDKHFITSLILDNLVLPAVDNLAEASQYH